MFSPFVVNVALCLVVLAAAVLDAKANPETPQLIFSSNFEDETYQQFTTDGGGTKVNTNLDRVCEGDVSVKLKKTSNLYQSSFVGVSEFDDLILSFWYYPKKIEDDDALSVFYSINDGSSWDLLLRMELGIEHGGQSYNGACHEKIIQFSSVMQDPSSIESIRIRFQAEADNKRDEFYIDDIRLEGLLAPSPSSSPSGFPSVGPSATPSTNPSATPSASKTPSAPPSSSLAPSAAPSQIPSSSVVPSSVPTSYLDRTDICPLNKTFPSMKYEILEFSDLSGLSYVEDDLSEISSLAFASFTDDSGNKYAYVVSDKNQYSLKVIKFTDSYDSSSLLSGTAETVAVYTLINVDYDNDDWEDISTGPCTDDIDDVSTCIYIGNFGNNDRGGPSGYDYQQRRKLNIFKFPEPFFSGVNGLPENQDIDASIITYDYNTTFQTDKFIDAEAMFVDWTGAHRVGMADIYVVTKGYCGRGVGRIAASLHKNLLPGQEVDIGSMEGIREDPPPQGTIGCVNPGPFRVYQAADMSRNGRVIALATGASPARTYFFPRETGQTVADALSGSHCSYVSATSFGLAHEKKHEAVAFLDDEGTIFAETSECNGGNNCRVPLYIHTLTSSPPPTSRTDTLDQDAWQELSYDDFEDGTFGSFETRPDNATDPDAILSSLFPCHGNGAVRLRWDNAASSSIFHSQDHDCTSFPWLKISFQFQLDSINSFDHMDALFLEFSLNSGADYTIAAAWAYDVDGIDTRGVCYQRTIELHAEDFGRATFGNNVRLRFRASANAKKDYVHVDDIRFEGHTGYIYSR